MGHEPWAQDKNFGAQPPDQTIHGRPRVQNLDSGVKGHMLINQQRILSIISFAGYRIRYQTRSTVIIVTGIKISISVAAIKWLLVRQEVGQ